MVLIDITSFYMYLRSIVIQGLKYQPAVANIFTALAADF